MSQPKIAVIGSTGLQGGAVVESLIRRGKFEVRALARSASSEGARRLAAQGVEVREADLTDAATLLRAFEGCHGVFVVTDTHSAKGDPEEEFRHGRNASDAAKQAGVRHLIFSSLEDVSPGLTDDMPASHPGLQLAVFQVKRQIEDYIRQQGLSATFLITSAYYENYVRWYRYQRLADGTYRLSTNVGTTPFAQNTVADIGESAAEAFERGPEVFGKDIPVVSETLGMDETTAIISEVTGEQVRFEAATDESIRGLPFGWAREVANMYQYFRTSAHYNASRPEGAQVVPGVPFRTWAAANREQLLERLRGAVGPEDAYTPFGADH